MNWQQSRTWTWNKKQKGQIAYLLITAESIDKGVFGGKLNVAKASLATILIW